MSDFTSYFDHYSRVNPDWADFADVCKERGSNPLPGYSAQALDEMVNPDGSPQLVEVTPDNYPKIYNALEKECAFRGVPVPACYVDTSDNCSAGWGMRGINAIGIEEGLYEVCSEKELRWLVAHELKHLYQDGWTSYADCRLAENDSDRAAVESVGYEATLGFWHKTTELKINQSISNPLFKKFALAIHNKFPNLVAERFPVAFNLRESDFSRLKIVMDKEHPSPAARMRHMREWDKYINEEPRPNFNQTVDLG